MKINVKLFFFNGCLHSAKFPKMQQVTENYLEHQLQKLKSEYGAYAQKQAEMDIERREHKYFSMHIIKKLNKD